jgi:hypothetical protein
MDDEDLYWSWNDKMAKEISTYCFELLEDLPANERDDVAIEVLISALAAVLLVYKIKNPSFTHKQILDEACSRVKIDFFGKAGHKDFTIPLNCVN